MGRPKKPKTLFDKLLKLNSRGDSKAMKNLVGENTFYTLVQPFVTNAVAAATRGDKNLALLRHTNPNLEKPVRAWITTDMPEHEDFVLYGVSDPSVISGHKCEEVQGPIPFNKRWNLTVDQLIDAFGENPTPIMKEMDNREKEASKWKATTNNPHFQERAEEWLSDIQKARGKLFVPDEQIQLDPQMYLDQSYAPWVHKKALKLITGED